VTTLKALANNYNAVIGYEAADSPILDLL